MYIPWTAAFMHVASVFQQEIRKAELSNSKTLAATTNLSPGDRLFHVAGSDAANVFRN